MVLEGFKLNTIKASGQERLFITGTVSWGKLVYLFGELAWFLVEADWLKR